MQSGDLVKLIPKTEAFNTRFCNYYHEFADLTTICGKRESEWPKCSLLLIVRSEVNRYSDNDWILGSYKYGIPIFPEELLIKVEDE